MYTGWQETYFQFGGAQSILMGFGKDAPQNFYMDISWAGSFRVVFPHFHSKSHAIALCSN